MIGWFSVVVLLDIALRLHLVWLYHHWTERSRVPLRISFLLSPSYTMLLEPIKRVPWVEQFFFCTLHFCFCLSMFASGTYRQWPHLHTCTFLSYTLHSNQGQISQAILWFTLTTLYTLFQSSDSTSTTLHILHQSISFYLLPMHASRPLECSGPSTPKFSLIHPFLSF